MCPYLSDQLYIKHTVCCVCMYVYVYIYTCVCVCVCVYDSIKSHENNIMVSSGSESHCTDEREIAVEALNADFGFKLPKASTRKIF